MGPITLAGLVPVPFVGAYADAAHAGKGVSSFSEPPSEPNRGGTGDVTMEAQTESKQKTGSDITEPVYGFSWPFCCQ